MTKQNKYLIHSATGATAIYDEERDVWHMSMGEHLLCPGIRFLDTCTGRTKDTPAIEAPTEEVKGNKLDELVEKICEIYSAGNNTIERSRLRPLLSGYLPKPVEQELIPLDIDLITEDLMNELFWKKDDTERKIIKAVLRKYGVPKQEEDEGITFEEAEEQIKQCIGIDTQQGTACIKCGLNIKTYLDGTCIYCHPRNKTAFEKSITPVVQKKRTEDGKEFIIISVEEREKMKEKARKYDNLR